MKDIQSQSDPRNMAIDRVGVKDLSYPITVLDRANRTQHTVGSINMFVNLPHHFRGTHMSRFIEILNAYHRELHIDRVEDILRLMKKRLQAQEAHMEVSFPYFVEKTAPKSRSKSLMEYQCHYIGTLREQIDVILGVDVPVTTLCPCSREMSDRGAHNQRSVIHIRVRYTKSGFIWIEELITMAEESASSPLYALLKRDDEKAVTENAYDHPMFVEDVVRDVSVKMEKDPRIFWYRVQAENFESIHNHSAYASIEKHKTGIV
jgi:GTP cyclohydrolase I